MYKQLLESFKLKKGDDFFLKYTRECHNQYKLLKKRKMLAKKTIIKLSRSLIDHNFEL